MALTKIPGSLIEASGNLTITDLTVTGDLSITGDLNSYNVTDLDVVDQTITLGAGQTEALSGGSGIIVDGSSASILWDETNDEWDFNKSINVTGNITGALAKVGSTATEYAEGHIRFKFNGGAYIDQNTVGQSLNFRVSGSSSLDTTAMTLDSSGNVGIGTISPASKLHITGTGTYNHSPGQNTTSDLIITSSEMTDNNYHSIMQLVSVRQSLSTGSGANGYLGFSTIDDSNGQGIRDAGRIAIVNETGTARNSATSLSFWTNTGGADTTAATERMRIDSSGNVGIGDPSPAAKLEIKQGSGDWYEGIRINRSSNTTQFGTFSNNSGATFIGAVDSAGGDNNAILFGNSTNGTTFTERMRIESDGNVGIGVASSYPLTVQSGIAGSNHAIALRNNSTNNLARLGFLQQDSATAAYTSIDGDGRSTGYLKFNTNDTERMRIESSGRITLSNSEGIKLSEKSSTMYNEDGALSYFASNNGVYLNGAGANGWLRLNASGVSNDRTAINLFGANAGDSINFKVANNTAFQINSSGNVTSPYTTGFQVTGTSTIVDQSSTGSESILSDKFNTAGGGGGHNIGNDYNTSTGIYTAPVDGRYLFGYALRWETNDFVMNSYIRTYISINNVNDFESGHQINGSNETFTSFMAMSGSAIVSLSAGDTVRLKGGMNGGTGKFYVGESSFYGILLG